MTPSDLLSPLELRGLVNVRLPLLRLNGQEVAGERFHRVLIAQSSHAHGARRGGAVLDPE
jgi:hypothetical protein